MSTSAPRLTLEAVHEQAHRLRNWGRWGDDDEVGTLNHVTPERIVAAAAEIRQGRVFSLAIECNHAGPQTGRLGRFNPVHAMTATGTDALLDRQRLRIQYADDLLTVPLHSTTHWDALSHIFYEGRMWNGYSAELVGAAGAERNGIEKVSDRMVGRGVLLDVARARGVSSLDDGEAISADDLDACARGAGVELRPGDFVLVRTGQLGRCLASGSWGDYAGGDAPGLGFDTLEWIQAHELAAVASDTWGVEVRPNQTDERQEAYQPWHWVAIPNIGLSVGEMFYLDELAMACAEDGRATFFFAAPPLPITGASGSVVNPLAIR